MTLQPVDSGKDEYTVGDRIAFQLRVTNLTEAPIEIDNPIFYQYTLDIFYPNEVHLIDPNGEDLFLPYHHSPPQENEAKHIQVKAHEETWFHFPISSYLLLDQPGEYIFWVKLVDSLGNAYTSNQSTFSITKPVSTVSPELLSLHIQPQATVVSKRDVISITVTFRNNSGQTVKFLLPQEGSSQGWRNPIYWFTVINEEGHALIPPLSEAIYTAPVYDDTTIFTLYPNTVHQFEVRIARFAQMQEPGQYKVQLSYIVSKTTWEGQPIIWPENVFVGLLTSNETFIEVVD